MVYRGHYDQFKQLHQPQLESSGVPQHFWPNLCRKLISQEFDAGKVFTLLQIEGADTEYDPPLTLVVKAEDGIKRDNPEEVYLVDHAWTFRAQEAIKQLSENEQLLERMAGITGVQECENIAEKVFNRLWKFCNYYKIQNAVSVEDSLAIWYVMDEVGSAVVHNDEANFRVVPFIYLPENITYSLLFPLRDVEYGEVVSRDFSEGVTDKQERDLWLLPWVYKSFEDLDFTHVPPEEDYFLSGHIKESLPNLSRLNQNKPKQKLKVFTEYSLIESFLTDSRFEITDNMEVADVLWLTTHFKKFEELSETPEKFVNQFPFEYILTIKDLLCVVCRRKSYVADKNLEPLPKWLPVTYNLKTELNKFVSYYQNRAKNNFDNYWIVKPFNLARGLDTHITDNLNYILRLAPTGPKIAQKYITNPILFDRPDCSGQVKFDIRYIILLKSSHPLQLYVYKNFFLRFSNKPFELNNFQDYEKHFTVMNYTESAQLKHMLCDEFRIKFSEQYPNVSWETVEEDIFGIFREIFECATMDKPPCGIAESPQSRAVYAVDLMLEWGGGGEVQPKILEVNWTPDCKRACDYYPEFYNDIFKLLFFGEENSNVFVAL